MDAYQRLLNERRKKSQELMEEYDEKVYFPALKKLREDCEANGGHVHGRYHDNGLGWHWYYCNRCGARYNLEKVE